MRISDCISDVCSSDLVLGVLVPLAAILGQHIVDVDADAADDRPGIRGGVDDPLVEHGGGMDLPLVPRPGLPAPPLAGPTPPSGHPATRRASRRCRGYQDVDIS